MTFNHFRVKREAHALGRNDSGWLNPFAHTWTKAKPTRSQTWSMEAQDRNDDLSPIVHAQTEPGLSKRPTSEEEYGGPSFTKKDEAAGIDPSQPDSSRTIVDSPPTQSPVIPQDRNVRQRNGKTVGNNEEPRESEAGRDDDGKKKKKEHRLFKTVHPKEPFTTANQLRRTLLNSWINVLLIFAPVGIALNYVSSVNRVVVFVVNFIAIIPLAAMLSFATEEIALRTGETLGGLLNATFGNAVEFIVAVLALTTQTPPKVVIVQTSLIGSILSNLLLVLGMCFFFGGLRRQEQFFNTTVAQTAASLLALAVASIIVPSVFDHNTSNESDVDVPALSRGTAVILLIVYGAYLYFQLKTHHLMFSEESQKVPMKPRKSALAPGAIGQAMVNPAGMMANGVSDRDELRKTMMATHPVDDDEGEDPQLAFWVAVGTLTASTVVIALCAEFMVGSIDAVTASSGLGEEFVGLILLPIVGNAAEHATAVTVAIKDKMDLAIGVAVGSSMQVALFLIPLLVIIGWGMGIDDMTMSFDLFQVAVMFVSVLLVNYLIGDGKSHWLEGMLLICLYFIIAVCTFWYPNRDESGGAAAGVEMSTFR